MPSLPRFRADTDRFGGITLTDTFTGDSAYLQPGDDAAAFEADHSQTNDRYDDQALIADYLTDLVLF